MTITSYLVGQFLVDRWNQSNNVLICINYKQMFSNFMARFILVLKQCSIFEEANNEYTSIFALPF